MKRVVAFDTETSLIRPGCCAPPISCLTFQIAEHKGGDEWRVHDPEIHAFADGRIYNIVLAWLLDPETLIVGHNIVFDLLVLAAEWPDLLPLIFQALEEDRITCTMLRGKVIDIGRGCYRGMLGDDNKWVKLGYSLLEQARRYCNIPIKKEGFRLFYGPLRNVPLSGWVDAARDLQVRGQRYLEWRPSADDPTATLADFDPELAYLEACLGDAKKFRGSEGLLGMINADAGEVTSYPLDDATSTLAVYFAQDVHEDLLEDQFRQVRKAWWLHLTSSWGLRTSAPAVAHLQLLTEGTCKKIEARLVDAGLIRKDGSRDTKKAKERMLAACGWHWDEGLGKYVVNEWQFIPSGNDNDEDGASIRPLRLTASNEVSLDSDACKASGDELLKEYANLTSLKAVLNKDVPALARAVVWPVHTHFDLAETGRTTSAGPNVQNWRRLPGIRECFVPRAGWVYAQADYSGLELATLAQACLVLLGHSALADALNAGKDPHTDLAALILGITYDEGVRRKKLDSNPTVKRGLAFRRDNLRVPTAKDIGATDEEFELYLQYVEFDNARQTAKVANFGFPGGLGPKKLVLFARKTYGVEMTEEQARELKAIWLAKWPEMADYFAFVNQLPYEVTPDGKRHVLKQIKSNRIRGGATYTAACNSFFQGLGADATAHAGWLIAKACYVDRQSPLFGCRIVNYVHDEFIVEAPEGRAAEAAEELSRLMVLGASEWIPDVKLQAEPCLMRVWSKDAKTLRDDKKRLVPWAPKAEEVKLAA